MSASSGIGAHIYYKKNCYHLGCEHSVEQSDFFEISRSDPACFSDPALAEAFLEAGAIIRQL